MVVRPGQHPFSRRHLLQGAGAAVAATGLAAWSGSPARAASRPAAVGALPASFESLPSALTALADDVASRLEPDLVGTFRACFGYAWQSTMQRLDDDSVFVITGDIPAMWLRDSAAQVRPYLAAATDPEVYGVLAGVVRRQARFVRVDPYANAFNASPREAPPSENPAPGPLVWERKYEVDSLCAPLVLAYALWRASGRLDHADDDFFAAAESILDLWRVEQDHGSRSPYYFDRATSWSIDTLPNGGRGTPVAPTGMTWSGFRPSDDACTYGYLVPSNAMAVVALDALAKLAHQTGRGSLGNGAQALRDEIAGGIAAHGRMDVDGVGQVYAYEVDGLGGTLLQDDANIPSLLSLPYLGFCAQDDETYQRNRRVALSSANRYYFSGSAATGIGSPHTPDGYVWPLALTMQALTSSDGDERLGLARLLHRTDAGTGYMHEGFDSNDPGVYTRPYFSWANALYSELLMELTGVAVGQWYNRIA